MTQALAAPGPIRSLRLPALGVGVLGLIGCAVAVFLDRPHFFRAYLFAYMLWLGITMGAMAIVMVHNLTGGQWGQVVRRTGEAAGLVLPLMALLFVPLCFGLHDLYPWANADLVREEHILHVRRPFLNEPWYIGRAVIYFALWIPLFLVLARWSARLNASFDLRTYRRLQAWSGLGLVLYLFTMTHAGVDWVMSRDIEFYSTTYGLIVTTGQALSGLAFMVLVACLRQREEPTEPRTLNDLGSLLQTLVILWAYVSFFQFLVIWMGNTREDNTWYTQRGLGDTHNPWRWIGLALVVAQFFTPFFLLLFRAIKRRTIALGSIAALVLLMRVIEQYWLVAPSGPHRGPVWDLTWIDIVAPIAIGGLWLAAFTWTLTTRPAVPSPLFAKAE